MSGIFANNTCICLRKNKSKQSYVWIRSIFKAQNIFFGSKIAKCAFGNFFSYFGHFGEPCAFLKKKMSTKKTTLFCMFWPLLSMGNFQRARNFFPCGIYNGQNFLARASVPKPSNGCFIIRMMVVKTMQLSMA